MTSSRERQLERPFVHGKARDQALVLPLVGLALLTPPIANVFQLDARLFGVPVTALYLFGAWALLILAAAALSRRLREEGDVPAEDGDPSAHEGGAPSD